MVCAVVATDERLVVVGATGRLGAATPAYGPMALVRAASAPGCGGDWERPPVAGDVSGAQPGIAVARGDRRGKLRGGQPDGVAQSHRDADDRTISGGGRLGKAAVDRTSRGAVVDGARTAARGVSPGRPAASLEPKLAGGAKGRGLRAGAGPFTRHARRRGKCWCLRGGNTRCHGSFPDGVARVYMACRPLVPPFPSTPLRRAVFGRLPGW